MSTQNAPKKSAVAPFPTTFSANQLFVAVSDTDGVAAGFDGGPEKGGSGAWSRGTIRRWTAESAVPLAVRDPKDGTIVRGYVEPVEEMGERNGVPVVTKSGKFFGTYNKAEKVFEPAAPTARAMKRATLGATSATKAFQPLAIQQTAAEDRLVAAGGRVSDQPVG